MKTYWSETLKRRVTVPGNGWNGPFIGDYNGGWQDGFDGAELDAPDNGLAGSAYREGYRDGMEEAKLALERA